MLDTGTHTFTPAELEDDALWSLVPELRVPPELRHLCEGHKPRTADDDRVARLVGDAARWHGFTAQRKLAARVTR